MLHSFNVSYHFLLADTDKRLSIPMMQQRISLITLGVADLARATAFYEALGWQNGAREPGIAAFDLQGSVLGLYPKADLARDLGVPLAKGFSGQTLSYNVATREEVAPLLSAARAAGATVLKEPHEVFWGGFIAYFADPDGHVWEVAHNPFSKLGPNGEFAWNGFGNAEDP